MSAERNPKVDAFFAKSQRWREEFEALREICLSRGLAEELKWGWPCYATQARNVVLMHGFKDYCALLFFKGALMKDPQGILIQQTENVQAGRQIRFRNVHEIVDKRAVLGAYLDEAVAIEKAGQDVVKKTTAGFKVPEEFQTALAATPALEAAFASLTPGRQRAYLLHFGSPKQANTRKARIEKAAPRILEGKGLDDG